VPSQIVQAGSRFARELDELCGLHHRASAVDGQEQVQARKLDFLLVLHRRPGHPGQDIVQVDCLSEELREEFERAD
jgi:hypothetical protein